MVCLIFIIDNKIIENFYIKLEEFNYLFDFIREYDPLNTLLSKIFEKDLFKSKISLKKPQISVIIIDIINQFILERNDEMKTKLMNRVLIGFEKTLILLKDLLMININKLNFYIPIHKGFINSHSLEVDFANSKENLHEKMKNILTILEENNIKGYIENEGKFQEDLVESIIQPINIHFKKNDESLLKRKRNKEKIKEKPQIPKQIITTNRKPMVFKINKTNIMI